MEKQIYFDGIGQINVTNGIVRIELASMLPEGEKLAPTTAGRLVTTLPGFLNTLASLTQMANKMVDAGILQRNAPAAATEEKKD